MLKRFAVNWLLVASTCFLVAKNAVADETIYLKGCPVQVAKDCLLLLDVRGTPYDITAAPARREPAGGNRAPSASRRMKIELTGTVAEGLGGRCRRGVLLNDIHWKYTREKCGAH